MATAILRPSANGDVIQLTPSPVVLNYLNVDEVIADEDATYNKCIGGKVGNWEYDLYELPNPGLAGTINFVKVWVRCRETFPDAWSYTKIKTHGVEYTGVRENLTTSYLNYSTQYNNNPNTTAAWTWAEIDALQAGVFLEVGYQTAHCTQVWVEIDYTPPVVGTNMEVNIGDVFKDIDEIQINIGDVWKDVDEAQINIGDVWKVVF